jgi:hypothetical protein
LGIVQLARQAYQRLSPPVKLSRAPEFLIPSSIAFFHLLQPPRFPPVEC